MTDAATTVRELDGSADASLAAWNAYVDGHADGTLAHRAEWAGLFRRVFGKRGHLLVAERDGRQVGALPLVHMHSLLFGNYMVSVPYLNYGGVLADDEAAAAALLDAAAALAGGCGAASIELREQAERAGGMPCREDKVAMLLDLPETAEALSKALGSKLRSQIKRPQRENPQVRHGGLDCLDEFYTVFARNMRDLGTPVYSKRLFEEILRVFPAQSHIVVVRLAGRPAAAAFLLGHRGVLEIPWASSLREFNRVGVNMLLYWECLSHAIEHGYRVFDFGRSTVDAGTYRFKKQWGAQPKQLYWHYWLAPGAAMPNLKTDNPKFDLVIRTWQKLPLWFTNAVGPHIVKHLP